MKLVIPGPPKGKGRPRVVNRGGFASAYTPKETKEYEKWVQQCWFDMKGTPEPMTGDVACEIWVYYPFTKSMSKKKREQGLSGFLRPAKKPDCDNIAKIILDALNNVAYEDDKQIVDLRVVKYYAEIPRVEVYLTEKVRNHMESKIYK